MDPEELKRITDLIQTATDELHKATARQDEEIKKLGAPMTETKESVGKINTDLTELKTRLDDLDTKMQRQTVPGADNKKEGEQTEEQKASSASFFKYVQGGVDKLNPDERKALVEDSTGQILVTPELETEITRSLPKITIMRPMVRVRPISKDRLKIRSVSEVSVGWGKLETGASITESNNIPGTPTYEYVEDLYGLAKIGEDELADSDINLIALLGDSFTRALGEAEELAWIRGAGHASEQPEGICINSVLKGNTVTSTAAGAVTFEKFMEQVYACPAQYRRNGQWVVHSSTELALRQLRSETDATYKGRFLWEPSLIAGAPNTFLGYPIHNQDDMKELSDTTQVISIFGDFKAGYRILDRAGMTIQRLTELYSEAGLVGFKIKKRVGGGLVKPAQKALVLMTEYV